ncbi:MAG: glycosyltransferase, partial [Chloroflexi bacterium]|nr:glycosyltransferase [Chloroflexota bacterium]
SMGEGFGVPVIEAQACGLPVIVSDFSAQPELCESGWLVKGQGHWDPLSGQGLAWFYDPYVPSIVKNLEAAYEARGDTAIRERAIAFAAAYNTDKVYDQYWRPFLAELDASEKPNRAARRRAAKAKAA